MLHLIAEIIPKDFFSTELLASEISNKIKMKLFILMKNDKEKANRILKSPGLFSIRSPFALKEYIKNIADAGGTMINIYLKINENDTITCTIVDNGSGFPDNFLQKESHEMTVSYYDKKLKDDTYEKSRITSLKIYEEKAGKRGGQGLGLATISRVLHKTAGNLLIGNISDLSLAERSAMKIDQLNIKKGAVIIVHSKLYSEEMHKLFDNNGKSLTDLYPQYIQQQEREELNHLHISSPTRLFDVSETFSPSQSSVRSLSLDMSGISFEDDDLSTNIFSPSI